MFGEPFDFNPEKWMWEAIFGTEYIKECIELKRNIDEVLEIYPDQFSISISDKRVVLSTSKTGHIVQQQKLDMIPISNTEAYFIFGIDTMEIAREKNYVWTYDDGTKERCEHIKMKYDKKIRRDKISDIIDGEQDKI